MQDIKLKPDFAGGVRTPRQSSETAQSLLKQHQSILARLSEVKAVSVAAKTMVVVRRLTGAMLGGTAVTVLIGNVLVCVSLMVLGPEFILGLLGKLNGVNT